jgi:hypothetical protein
MASRTVLELVQDIITETGGDEVNSISDTIEAGDVATILRQVYSEIVDEYSLPSTRTIQALTGLGDVARPNMMQIPEGSYDIQWIKYDNRTSFGANKDYQPIKYLSPEEFVTLVNSRPSTDTTNYTVVQWDSNVPLVIHKKLGPQFWTSFDDDLIVFDAYNTTVESTLQSSKSIVYVETRPSLTVADDFIPDLPENLENLLYIKTLNRVLSTDDIVKPGLMRQESRSEVRTQRNKWREGRQIYNTNNFGRK